MKHKLPKKINFNGKIYELEWESTSNMDGFKAFFKTDLKFESEEEADDYAYNNPIDHVDHFDIWQDGTVRVLIKPFK
jgi:hypothetical protein